MSSSSRRLLAFGLTSAELERLRSVLDEPGCEVELAPTWTGGLERVKSRPYSVVLARYPAPGAALPDLVAALRDPGSPCLACGAVILAEPDSLREVGELVGLGINKVVSLLEHADVLKCVLMRLESVAAPDGERIQIRLEIEARVGEAWRRWRTGNVSLRGLLVETPEPVKLAATMRFRLHVPAEARPVEGELKVIRLTDVGHETVRGFGARFVRLDGDGRSRLAAFVERRRTRIR
jgi:hypothetical protein